MLSSTTPNFTQVVGIPTTFPYYGAPMNLLLADALTDVQDAVVDETAAPQWFVKFRATLGLLLGGLSKVKVIKVTSNSVTFKFRAHGLVLDYAASVKLAAAVKQANVEVAIFTENQRMYLLAVEK